MTNKGPGSDMKFVFWDDPGDSQDSVDNQCDCPPWKTEIAYNELRKACCIAREKNGECELDLPNKNEDA